MIFSGGPNRKDFDKTELQHRIAFMMVNEAALLFARRYN